MEILSNEPRIPAPPPGLNERQLDEYKSEMLLRRRCAISAHLAPVPTAVHLITMDAMQKHDPEMAHHMIKESQLRFVRLASWKYNELKNEERRLR